MAWPLAMKSHLSYQYQRTASKTSQHWFRLRFGAVERQSITRANVDPDLCLHMASLVQNGLTLLGIETGVFRNSHAIIWLSLLLLLWLNWSLSFTKNDFGHVYHLSVENYSKVYFYVFVNEINATRVKLGSATSGANDSLSTGWGLFSIKLFFRYSFHNP